MLDTKQLDRRTFESLGHADHGWLDARHHFSFASYHDPARMGWGAIRVWNDDTIGRKTGFPPHPHRDMEIITYVRTGAITHQDSMGNKGRTGAGDVQVMSAGHRRDAMPNSISRTSRRRCSRSGSSRATRGVAPAWGSSRFPKARSRGQAGDAGERVRRRGRADASTPMRGCWARR